MFFSFSQFKDLDGLFAVQEYIQQQIRVNPQDLEAILTCPSGADPAGWLLLCSVLAFRFCCELSFDQETSSTQLFVNPFCSSFFFYFTCLLHSLILNSWFSHISFSFFCFFVAFFVNCALPSPFYLHPFPYALDSVLFVLILYPHPPLSLGVRATPSVLR